MKLYKDTRTAEEKNAWTWHKYGLAEDGSAYIVINKYAKAADMKPLGARWCPELGWHFDSKQDDTFYVSALDIGDFDSAGEWSFKPNVEAILDKFREQFIPESDSEYIGEIGEKVKLNVIFDKWTSFESSYGYGSSTTIFVYTFIANGKDTVVWMTGTDLDVEEGKEYTIIGTVKDHREYRKDKQTILTRCKIFD